MKYIVIILISLCIQINYAVEIKNNLLSRSHIKAKVSSKKKRQHSVLSSSPIMAIRFKKGKRNMQQHLISTKHSLQVKVDRTFRILNAKFKDLHNKKELFKYCYKDVTLNQLSFQDIQEAYNCLLDIREQVNEFTDDMSIFLPYILEKAPNKVKIIYQVNCLKKRLAVLEKYLDERYSVLISLYYKDELIFPIDLLND